MQKRILSAAVALAASTLALSASAASVQVYGTIDTGLTYLNTKVTGEKSTSEFRMDSALSTDSLFGLAGEEEIGDMTVSFVLENTFGSDSGEFSDSSRLFDYESQVSVSGRFGTLSLGRMGVLTAGAGTYDVFQAIGDSMDGGYGDIVGTGYWFDRDIYDNMVTYASPELGAFQFYAQYSFGTDADDSNHSRGKNRYAAIGATFTAGDFQAALVVDSVLKNRDHAAGYAKDLDDSFAVSFGMNYDMEFMHPFFGVQYGKHENSLGGFAFDPDEDGYDAGDFDGFAVHLGSAFPVLGGELQVSVFYADGDGYGWAMEKSADKYDVTTWGIGLFHNYELSKRTSLYFGLGYSEQEVQMRGADKEETKIYQAMVGIAHSF